MGGNTFNNGLYRIHTFRNSVKWSLLMAEYFKEYANKFYPFGFDWLGRQFCLSGDTVIVFDMATGEIYQMQQSIASFHDENIVDDTDDIMSINLFSSVIELLKLDNLNYTDCLGFKVPLFLGGQDVSNNYELQDMEVYWHLSNQLYHQIKDLPEGTKIGDIKLQG